MKLLSNIQCDPLSTQLSFSAHQSIFCHCFSCTKGSRIAGVYPSCLEVKVGYIYYMDIIGKSTVYHSATHILQSSVYSV